LAAASLLLDWQADDDTANSTPSPRMTHESRI